MSQKVYYQNKTKIGFYSFMSLLLALVAAMFLLFDTSLGTADKIMFTVAFLLFGGVFLLSIRQMMNATKPFLVITDSHLQLNYPQKTITVPKEHVIEAKLINQRVYRNNIKHIAIELTEEGYAEYIKNLSSTVKGIGVISSAMYPEFENCITVPRTLKNSNEITSAVNEWLRVNRLADI